MAVRAREAIIPYVRSLITQLSAFKEGEENFELCERYALSNLWHHRFLSVDSHAVRRSIDGIITKFEVHGHLNTSVKLRQLVDKLLSYEDFSDHPQYDIQWSLLSLLLNLAINPTTAVHHVEAAPVVEEAICEDEDFDWTSYLREGDERFICPDDSDSSDEEWNSASDESSNELEVVPAMLRASIQQGTQSHKEGLIHNLREIYLAEEWMDANIHCVWERENKTEENNILKLNLTTVMKDHLAKQGNSTENHQYVISVYMMIRQILFMFYTTCNTQLFEVSNNKIIVKSRVTVSSLTMDTVMSYLHYFCPYFEMLRELRGFGEDLSKCEKLPPLTYVAYWNEMKELLSDLNSFLTEVEIKVKKQDGICTLLWLKNELQPKLVELECVYCVHVRAVYDWTTSPNWLSAVSLLSVLYGELLKQSNNDNTTIYLRLFLKSFQVYLNIIDTWLTDGELVDTREEFIISRDGEVQPYEELLNRAGIEPLPVLKLIISNVIHSVSSVDFLLKLNKLPEFNRLKGSLYEELIESVTNELMKFINSPPVCNIETNNNDTVKKEENTFFAAVKDHVLYFADPFLLKAFENYLPFNNDEQEEVVSDVRTKQSFTILQYSFAQEILPLKPVTEKNLIQLIDDKCKAACYLVKTDVSK
ncbi:hypothetical protein L9F63_003702 [Diploptera punctata]|uniref:Gamma-tubulin complex component n=1 Tax=Diploptera punctata TaxID=6984 RepID=A0AAD7ZJL0_DIPPU|nr:hypothetical protein L9F63_003702 [Diploptera punctata]